MKQAGRPTCGFTMIETLVGLGVFLSISLLVTEVFVASQRLSRVHVLDQQIQNDLRAAAESLSLEVRGGFVDYDRYTGSKAFPATGPVRWLFTRDEDQTQIEITSSNETTACSGAGGQSCCTDTASSPCLVKLVKDPTDPPGSPPRISAITGRGVRVLPGFPAFYIFPKVNPTLGNQPRTVVTALLRAQPSNVGLVTGAHPLYIQTTITPRNQPLP